MSESTLPHRLSGERQRLKPMSWLLDRLERAHIERFDLPVIGARAMIALVAASTCALPPALAQDAPPANTLLELERQSGACIGSKPLGPPGSRLTIMLTMKRDGSLFGRPRITFSHLEGDADQRRRFVGDAERAVEACLPFRITPALGRAIAGRPFFVTLGRPKPERGI